MYAFFEFRKTVGSARGPYVHIRILFLRMNRSHRPKVQCLRGVFVIDSICFQACPLWKGNFWPYHRMAGVWDWKQTQQIVHPERWRWQRTENGTSPCCLERGEPTKSWFRTGHSASIWSTWNQHDSQVFRDVATSSSMTTCMYCNLDFLFLVVDSTNPCDTGDNCLNFVKLWPSLRFPGVRKKRKRKTSSSSSEVMITSTENTDVIITRADGGRSGRSAAGGAAPAASGTIDIDEEPDAAGEADAADAAGEADLEATTFVWKAVPDRKTCRACRVMITLTFYGFLVIWSALCFCMCSKSLALLA